MKIKKLFCPLNPTFYLVGGAEFGHLWRRVDGESRIICRKCSKTEYCGTYPKESKEAKELLDLINPKTGNKE